LVALAIISVCIFGQELQIAICMFLWNSTIG
jgi:hypothetical protein